MSQSTREVRAIIEPALQCIVDFADSLRYISGRFCIRVLQTACSDVFCTPCVDHFCMLDSASAAWSANQSQCVKRRWQTGS